MLSMAWGRKQTGSVRVSEAKSISEATLAQFLDLRLKIRRMFYVMHLHNSRIDYFSDIVLASVGVMRDRKLRRSPERNGRALPRAQLGIEFCADRSVTTGWNESIQVGES